MVTSLLSAVHFAMLDASRTLVIWAFNLMLGIGVLGATLIPFGEQWNNTWSWLQLLGFLILFTGQTMYGDLLRMERLEITWTEAWGLLKMKWGTEVRTVTPKGGRSPGASKVTV